MRRFFFLLCLLNLLSASFLNAQKPFPKKFKLPAVLTEASGLYIASPDSLWWHNDSGDQPRLILTDARGNFQKEIILPVTNQDWEDLCADKQGNIFIGEFGNNQNMRKNLKIYQYNLRNNTVDSIVFNYPDQNAFPPPPAQANFDMEGFFYYNDSLHLFSKNRLLKGNYYTKHYVLPAAPGTYTAELRDSIQLKNRVVTAAAISPDGQTVALLSYFFRRCLGIFPISRTTVFTLQNFNDTAFLQGEMKKKRVGKFIIPTQYECLDFIDNQTIYIASERTPLFKQQAKKVKLKTAKVKP